MEVGGKRLTLAVFRQIPCGGYMPNDCTYLGWVLDYGKNEDHYYVLYIKDGILSKAKYKWRHALELKERYFLEKNQIYIAI